MGSLSHCDFWRPILDESRESVWHCYRGHNPRSTEEQRKTKGGGETQGRGKHTIKPLPKNSFGPPHLRYDFPPPLCSRNVILLRGNGHRPDKSPFLRPPKLGLRGAPYSTFSPPKIVRYVLPPPPCEFPNLQNQRAENGGLDPSWLDFAFLGRPGFSQEVPKTL